MKHSPFLCLTLSVDVLNNWPPFLASPFPVIRQSNVKHSPFFPSHPVGRRVKQLAAVPGLTFFRQGNPVVHLIREDLEAVYALFGLTDHVPVMGVTHDLPRSELNPFVFSVCH